MPSAAAQAKPEEQALTAADLAEAGYDLPGELVRGHFIPMSPTGSLHAEVESNLAFALKSFVKGKHLGKVLTGEVGIITGRSPDTVRGADVAYISFERLKAVTDQGYLDVAPELIAEVVSPSDRWTDINEKLEEYFAVGAAAVWIVDPTQRHVYAHRSPTRVEKLGPADTLAVDDVLPGLRIRVADLFED